MILAMIPKAIIIDFEKDPTAKFKEVQHYNHVKGVKLFSERLNIAVNRGFSKATYTYSLKIRKNGKWSKQITGLYPTENPNFFYGDTMSKTNLILVQFCINNSKLRLFYFKNFYTIRVNDFLKNYLQL